MESFHPLKKRSQRGGFSFVEILIAMGVLVLFSATALAALTQYNRYAYAARLRAHGLALAQQRIDEVMTTYWRVDATRPTVIAAGTRTENNLVMNADSFNTQAALKSDFTALSVPNTCTRVTQITNLTTRTFRVTVTVTFTYAKRNYTIALSSIRTSDTF